MFKWLFAHKLNDVLQGYLQEHKLAANTVKLTKRAWSQMVQAKGNIPIRKFTPIMAVQIQAFWEKRMPSATTARIYRKSVSPLFSWAVEMGWIRTNPFFGVKLPRATKRQVRVYSSEEFRRMLEACRHIGDPLRWIAILLLARTTGMRKSAIQNLTRDEINFEDEIITVREKFNTEATWHWQLKDREERILPLLPVVSRILREVLSTVPIPQPYVILKPTRYYHLIECRRFGCLTDDMQIRPLSNFDRIFRKIKKRAGVKGRFHDLRSTCLTGLADDLNPQELMLIGGHSDIGTTMRYVGIGRDVVTKARESVIRSLGA